MTSESTGHPEPVDDGSLPDDKPIRRSAKRKAVRSPERAERLRKQAERKQAERQRLRELKERLPPKRDRFTPVTRLRRKAVASVQPLSVGHHAPQRPKNSSANSREDSPTDSSTQTFRLVCWNIEDGLDVDGTIAGLTSHPNLADAAAICLQEMDPEGVERIGIELGLNYVYLESSRDERTDRGFGNAILSPFPLTDCKVVSLPHVAKAFGRPRAAVSSTVNVPATTAKDAANGHTTPFSVTCVHAEIPSLPLSKRIAQYTAAAAAAIAPNPARLLIAGDFNTTTITSVVALDELYELFGLDRLSHPAGPSLRRAGRLFYLDHIYGRGLVVEDVGVEREVIASDHWPMWVDVVTA